MKNTLKDILNKNYYKYILAIIVVIIILFIFKLQIACILSGIPYNNAQSIYTFYTNNTKYSVVSVKDKEETKLYLKI